MIAIRPTTTIKIRGTTTPIIATLPTATIII